VLGLSPPDDSHYASSARRRWPSGATEFSSGHHGAKHAVVAKPGSLSVRKKATSSLTKSSGTSAAVITSREDKLARACKVANFAFG